MSLFKPKVNEPPQHPAAAALAAHLEDQRAIARDDSDWATREAAQIADLRALDAARSLLSQLESRHVAALADVQVHGHSEEDPEKLATGIEQQRKHVDRLSAKGKVAEAALVRIRAARQRGRERQRELADAHPLRLHAALVERMEAAGPRFRAAEKEYLAAFVEAFGCAAAADRIARTRPQLGFTLGGLRIVDMLLPRPVNPVYQPRPDRPKLWATIETRADEIAKELLG